MKLLSVLESQKTSHVLNLNELIIGDDGCKMVSEFLLSRSDQFQSIQLRGNSITGVGMKELSKGMKFQKKLRQVGLEWNQIGRDESGMEAINEVCEFLGTVEELDLQNNKLGKESGKAISELLRMGNSRLRYLDLKWNELDDSAGEQIIQSLKENLKIVKLDVTGNSMSSSMVNEIESLVQRNYKVKQEAERALIEKSGGKQILQGLVAIEEQGEKERQFERTMQQAYLEQMSSLKEQVMGKDRELEQMEREMQQQLLEEKYLEGEVLKAKQDLEQMEQRGVFAVREVEERVMRAREGCKRVESIQWEERKSLGQELEQRVREMMGVKEREVNGVRVRWENEVNRRREIERGVARVTEQRIWERMKREEGMGELEDRVREVQGRKWGEQGKEEVERLETVKRKVNDEAVRVEKELGKIERKMIDESKEMEEEISRVRELVRKEHQEISKIVAEISELEFKLAKGDWKLEHLQREKASIQREFERMDFDQERELHDWEGLHAIAIERAREEEEISLLKKREFEEKVKQWTLENERIKDKYQVFCRDVQKVIGGKINEVLAQFQSRKNVIHYFISF